MAEPMTAAERLRLATEPLTSPKEVREAVRERYAAAAEQAAGSGASCCGSAEGSCCARAAGSGSPTSWPTPTWTRPPGVPGAGKSHPAIALELKTCQAGHRVAFATAQQWVDRLESAQQRNALDEELRRLERYGLAAALIDRLFHHATMVTLKGKSYRLRERGQASRPLFRLRRSAAPPERRRLEWCSFRFLKVVRWWVPVDTARRLSWRTCRRHAPSPPERSTRPDSSPATNASQSRSAGSF
ncbi:MAG: ATP-binding protein [Thermoleophilaceae bacterium]|nr:ATP-binding protein [Thermoleophilaceae bacterium]